MSGLCDYKDIFGAPSTGAHKLRLFNIAIVDLLLTIAVAWLVSWYMGYGWLEFVLLSVILVLISIPVHKLFCVQTTLTKIV